MREGAWPWPTLLANLVGAALLGCLLTALDRTVPEPSHLRAFVGTGFCGALTTFSTFQLETLRLAGENGALAGAYALASLLLGMAVAIAGSALARYLSSG